MSKLNATDIQGFVLRGYNFPFARYIFLHFQNPQRARKLVDRLLGVITTGQRWDQGKPQSTVNVAFSHAGLVGLDLPIAALISFPVEFQQGMMARAASWAIPEPTGPNIGIRSGGRAGYMRGSASTPSRSPRLRPPAQT